MGKGLRIKPKPIKPKPVIKPMPYKPKPGKRPISLDTRDDADIREMLGDKASEYDKAIAGLGRVTGNTKEERRESRRQLEEQRRQIREQFGAGSDKLTEFRTGRENKKIDDLMAQYGSFDKYETETRNQNRKKQIEAMINRGDIEGAMAAEGRFKEEDTKREAQKGQLEEFRKRYGIEAPPAMDERERFRQSINPGRRMGDALGGLLGGGAFLPKPLPYKPDPTRPVEKPTIGRQNPSKPAPPGMEWQQVPGPRDGHKGQREFIWQLVPVNPNKKNPISSSTTLQAIMQAGQIPGQQPPKPTTPAVQQPQQPPQQQAIGPQQQQQQMQAQMYQTQPAQQSQQQPNQQQETEEEKQRRLAAAGNDPKPPTM